MTYGPATDGDPRMRTEDGVAIVDGGRYWNYYDLEWVTVEFGDSMSLSPTGEYWDGWFTVASEGGGPGDRGKGHRYALNGARMASYEARP